MRGFAPVVVATSDGNIVITEDGTVTIPFEGEVTFAAPAENGRAEDVTGTAFSSEFRVLQGRKARAEIPNLGSLEVSWGWPMEWRVEDARKTLAEILPTLVAAGIGGKEEEEEWIHDGNPVDVLVLRISEVGTVEVANEILSKKLTRLSEWLTLYV